jgi:hypothetical protein
VAVEEAIFDFSRLVPVSRDSAIFDAMKLVVQVQLLPDRDQAARLRTVVERFNKAANHVAGIAFEHRTANVFELRRLCTPGSASVWTRGTPVRGATLVAIGNAPTARADLNSIARRAATGRTLM